VRDGQRGQAVIRRDPFRQLTVLLRSRYTMKMQGESHAHAVEFLAGRSHEVEEIGALAAELLGQLYELAAGGPPRVVRHYHEDDALLLLLRFDPTHLSGSDTPGSPLSEAALMALPDMIASAVRARCAGDHRLIPGSLTISSDRSFVSLGFSVVLEAAEEDQPERAADAEWPTPRLQLVS
jgi:hypothetical protein